MPAPNYTYEPCTTCGAKVKRVPSHAERFAHVFCSRECYWEWRRQSVTRICRYCGSAFTNKPSRMTDSRGFYCSNECYNLDRRAQIVKLVCQTCGKTFTRQTGHLNASMYRGKYCSQACAWEGRKLLDSSRSVYNHEFTKKLREAVRKRDGYVCQLCGKPQSELTRKLDVHHIDYDKTNNDMSNLISLCTSCHTKTNYRRDDWISLMRTILLEA